MCGDHQSVDERPGITRRRLLQGTGLAAAGLMLPKVRWDRPAVAAAGDGTSPVSMAMHIHSSFSEQDGSMEGHLAEAARNAVDVVWWTDHDYRMSAYAARRVVHFTSLTNESGDGKPWQWQQQRTGPLTTASVGGIVSSPASPLDSVPAGSLHLRAQSAKSGTEADLRYYAESHPADWNYHNNLTGQALCLEVFPEQAGRFGYLELLVTTSYHPARAGRPAGQYAISYRFGDGGTPGNRVANGLLGVVTINAPSGRWNSVLLRPAQDIAALWPDMDARDFALFGLRLGAVSSGTVTSGYFDYLRFSRATSGDVPLQDQQAIGAALASTYPGVTQRQGLEVSYSGPHVNWFGGGVSLPDYSGSRGRSDLAFLKSIIADIHARGGLSSYNHPFGAKAIPALSQATQDQRQADVAAALLANNVLDNDLIEVGYRRRSGIDLAHHVGVWDVCSRDGLFLTGTGVSDDHAGHDWTAQLNNWVTSAWATSKSEADLLAALAAGRAWSGSLTGFRGALDLADGGCPMGSVSVSSLPERQLQVTATGVPARGSVRVVQGIVDYSATPTPSNRVVATYRDTALATGSVGVPIDTSTSSYVRTEVLNAAGTVVGLSNPVWLLRERPPNGIPAARAC